MSGPRKFEPPRPTLEEIFEAQFGYVWNTLRRLGVHARDLDDVTHDVFLQVFKKLDEYDPGRPIRPWLFAFGLRAASDYRKLARHRTKLGVDHEPAVDAAPLADERLAQAEDEALVAAALAVLDLDRRAVFVLHDLDDCPVPEIAKAIGIPVNTAYSRLRLAREEFTRAIQRLRAREK